MKRIGKTFLFFCALAAFSGAAIAALAAWNFFLQERLAVLNDEISQTRAGGLATVKKLRNEISNLNTDIESLNEILAETQDELATTTAARDRIGLMYNDAVEKYNLEKARVDDLNSQVSDIQGTVTILEKIKQTDPELLKKYSKVYFLNENYAPAAFAAIDPEYTADPKEEYLFNSRIWPFLKTMMATARADGIDIEIVSAYRSFSEQSNLKTNYKMVYGSGANKFSADQGYSEHQLGSTVDVSATETGSTFDGFEKTAAYQWLRDNAHTYGFVLSYPQNNKYYQFEPWHWRFVGRELAQKLHTEGKNFYDLDQREIDSYLVSFFD